MKREKLYKEQIHHTTADLPVALHRMKYPCGTDVLFYLHWHKEFEFFVVTEGRIEFTIESNTYLLEPGDCVFINSDAYHSAKNAGRESCSFFALDFSYEFLQENMHTNFSRRYIRPILDCQLIFPELIHSQAVPSVTWQVQAVTYLYDINECGEETLFEHELIIKTRIYQIWELFYKHAVLKTTTHTKISEQKDRLSPVFDYIQNNYSYEITLSQLSQLLPMSEGQFCRIFKEAMKVSPFQYLMRYRIMKSCSLLIETDKKIGEIANLSGFNNISYYNKVFLKMIGCTPKQYRNSYITIPPST